MWTLTQTDDALWYHVYKEPDRKRKANISTESKSRKRFKAVEEEEEPEAVEEKLLRDYFQLSVKLGDLYSDWGAADPHFRRIADTFTGQCQCCRHIQSLLLPRLTRLVPSSPRCAAAAPGTH